MGRVLDSAQRPGFVRPRFSESDAVSIVRNVYGLSCRVKELDSYSDQNFLVMGEDGDRRVLKIANAAESEAVLRFQQGALDHLAGRAPDLNCPRLVRKPDGSVMTSVSSSDETERHWVWMVSYLSGHFIADLSWHSRGLLTSLGSFLGKLDRALESYAHPAMDRFFQWDLKQAAGLYEYLPDIEDEEKREIVDGFIRRFERGVAPRFGKLRWSVIHNDANDYNVLATKTGEDWHVSGVIDFGDMVRTCTVCEPAVAIAYMIPGKEDVLETAGWVLHGYQQEHPLTPEEVDVLFDLVCIRLCTSVCMSARQRKYEPDNDYLAVSEQPAWDALKTLQETYPAQIPIIRAGRNT